MERAFVLAQLFLLTVVGHAADLYILNGLSNVLGGLHDVHLRTGIIDVDAEHRRLPSLTPSARRLLQHPSPAPTSSAGWGPLNSVQLWLLTLGPELHVHSQHLQHGFHQIRVGEQRGHLGRTAAAVAAGESAAAEGHHSAEAPPLPQFAERQAALAGRLRQAGCAVVSFLPPAAWMVAVPPLADLAPLLEEFPDIRMAPFSRPERRVSPELAAVMAALRRAGQRGAELLEAGARVDELLEEVSPGETGLLLGSVRLHQRMPGRKGTAGSSGSDFAGGSGLHGTARASAGGSDPADHVEAQRPRVQLEVLFPHLETKDLEALWTGLEAEEQSSSTAEESQGGARGGVGDGDAAGFPGRKPRPSGNSDQYHPAAAAAADWTAPLAAVCPKDCPPILEPDHDSPHVLLVSVCPAALEAVVMWLAAAPQVTWLAPRMAARVHNLDVGAIVQTGGNFSAASAPNAVSSHPLWGAGLDGSGQIVGCGDSGLDMGSCFFNDPAVPLSQNIKTLGGMQYFQNATHRKVVYYLAVVQDMLDGYGHGTHVSGTLVGSPYDKSEPTAAPLADGTGQAPKAKIAFMDLSRERTDSVWTPGDLAISYFPRTYGVGARVHSDSWGSDLTAYDSMAQALDRFTWRNGDFLSVFAAGNSGDRQGVNTTITSPAVAKNCIAAGATLTMKPYQYDANWVTMYNMTVTLSLAGGQGFVRTVRVVRASFGANFGPSLDNTALVAGVPSDGCSSLLNAGAVQGKVVLVQRGNCYFTDKARSALAAGAVAVVVYNDRLEGGYFALQAPDSASGAPISLPVGGVPLSTGRWLLAAMNAGTPTVTFRSISEPSTYVYYEDIAPYSSFGPTTDGRIKPDIVAPGSITSAESKPVALPARALPYCNVKPLQGTSMATPVVAGSALLVRQYFVDGYYPTGKPDPTQAFTPSGALIKAVLLGGASHMKGVTPDTGMPLEDVPSYRQGFGRVNLLRALPLPVPNSPGWRLQVVDGENSGAVLRQGGQHRFCVRATGGPLRITLAWYDFPAEPAAQRALVNNLDLQVRAAGRGGIVDYGNGMQDAVNTVEQVWYDNLYPGDVAITVSAPTIFVQALQQKYALVVQGMFSGTLRPPSSNSSSVDTCAAQLVVIDVQLSVNPVTKNKNPYFYFSLQEGGDPQGGYECRLSPDGLNSTDSWTACSSPVTYNNVVDGRYSFQVRVRGEEVAATRPLLIDTQPPVTTLTSTLSNDTTSSAPDNSTVSRTTGTTTTTAATNPGEVTTVADGAVFSFIAQDASVNIFYQCQFVLTNNASTPTLRFASSSLGGPTSPGLAPGGPVPLSRYFNCTSPLGVVGMAFGDYQFMVIAFDEARNSEQNPKSLRWKVRYAPNTVYTRMLSGPAGIINVPALSYGLVCYVAGARTDIPPLVRAPGPDQPVEWLLLPAANTVNSSVAAVANARAWTRLSGADLQLTAPRDDHYLVLARPAGSADNATWAEAAVHVDTTPPLVAILRKPPSVQSDPRVTVSFGDAGTEGDIRAYFCRWLGPEAQDFNLDALDAASPTFTSCSGSSTVNVTEGFWLFQVKGRDVAGNLGYPTNVTFRTDLSPPNITVTDPGRINSTTVEYFYSVDDGPSGTGAVNISCSFKWVSLVSDELASGTPEYPAASATAGWTTPCPSPAARYTVQEGLFLWSLTAFDRAGLKSSVTLQLTVDFTPPISRIFSPQWQGRMLPSKVTFQISSSDKPDESASGVAEQQCRLDGAAAPPPPSPPPASPPPRLPPGSRAASTGGSSGGSGRRLTEAQVREELRPQQQQEVGDLFIPPDLVSLQAQGQVHKLQPQLRRRMQQQQPGGLKLPDGRIVQLGEWHACDPYGNATNVMYSGFSTGYYTLVLRALDRAGNLGNTTSPYFFGVDATLPDDGSDTVEVGGDDGANDKTKKIIIGVAVLVGAIILIASIVGIIYARRHHLRKRYGGHPPMPHGGAANGIAMQPTSYGNGHTNGHAGLPVMLPTVPSGGGAVVTAVPAPGVPYYPVVNGVVAGTPATADPALAAALVQSVAEADAGRARSAAALAAAEAAEQERVRRAIAASLEEENLRRAMRASMVAAEEEVVTRQRATAEQAALDAAIAASLATAEADQRRQHSQARAQLQTQTSASQPSAPFQPQPPPQPRPPPPPKESLI